MKHTIAILAAFAATWAMSRAANAAEGTAVGKGGIPNSQEDLYDYCSSVVGILEDAEEDARIQWHNGNLPGARKTLVDGLRTANGFFQNTYAPLTQHAVKRGIELNNVFQNACLPGNDPCLDLEMRAALYFLNNYYKYIVHSVAPLDKDYYVPFIVKYRHATHFRHREHSDGRGHEHSRARQRQLDGDRDVYPGDVDGGAGYAGGYSSRDGYAGGDGDGAGDCDNYECLPEDWGTEFFVKYTQSAEELLEFYSGKGGTGFPVTMAKNVYQLGVAERVLKWASEDLNADLWRQTNACLIEELNGAYKKISTESSIFANKDQAYHYASGRIADAAEKLERIKEQGECVRYPRWSHRH